LDEINLFLRQVSLYNILSKFNGETEKEYKTYKDNFLKKFEITRLPPYIILYIKRFTKNTFYVEKNPTIVNFPIKSIEFGELLSPGLKAKYPDGGQYDLMANIVHEGNPKKGTYKLHTRHEGKERETFVARPIPFYAICSKYQCSVHD
jgi:U4/U6.U5 tri-snRNP-associated protein 2